MVTVVWVSWTETCVGVCSTTSTAVACGFCRAMAPPRGVAKKTAAEVQARMDSSGWRLGTYAGDWSGTLGMDEQYSTCAPTGLRSTTRLPVRSAAPARDRTIQRK